MKIEIASLPSPSLLSYFVSSWCFVAATVNPCPCHYTLPPTFSPITIFLLPVLWSKPSPCKEFKNFLGSLCPWLPVVKIIFWWIVVFVGHSLQLWAWPLASGMLFALELQRLSPWFPQHLAPCIPLLPIQAWGWGWALGSRPRSPITWLFSPGSRLSSWSFAPSLALGPTHPWFCW